MFCLRVPRRDLYIQSVRFEQVRPQKYCMDDQMQTDEHSVDGYLCGRCDLGFSSMVVLLEHLEKMHGGHLSAQLRNMEHGTNTPNIIGEIERQDQKTDTHNNMSCDIVEETVNQNTDTQNINALDIVEETVNQNTDTQNINALDIEEETVNQNTDTQNINALDIVEETVNQNTDTQNINALYVVEESETQNENTDTQNINALDVVEESETQNENTDTQNINALDIVEETVNQNENTYAQSSNRSGILGERESHEQNSNCPEVNIQDNIISEDRNNGDEGTSTETNNPQKHGQNQGRKRRHCRKCGKDYSTRRELKAHRCLRKLKSFPCKECEKVFARPSDLQEHMIVHIEPIPYSTSCKVCGEKFHRYSAKKEHMKIHTGKKTYLCGECGETFALSASLKMHMRIHALRPGPCTECGRTFATLIGLKRHMLAHSGEKRYSCTYRGKTFARDIVEVSETQNENTDTQNVNTLDIVEETVNQNENTYAQSSNRSGILGERESHEQNSNRPEVNIQDNIISEDRNNGDEGTSTETNKPQKHGQNQGRKRRHCRKCGKDYSTRRELKAHRCLRKLKSFPCKECEKVFARSSDLHEHMIVHIVRIPYSTSCKVCGEKFNQFSAKKEHMKNHTGKKTYLCGECGETFALSANLKMHMRIHTLRPGPCTECGRTFATLIGLKRHMLAHSGEKRYSCTYRGKTFARDIVEESETQNENTDTQNVNALDIVEESQTQNENTDTQNINALDNVEESETQNGNTDTQNINALDIVEESETQNENTDTQNINALDIVEVSETQDENTDTRNINTLDIVEETVNQNENTYAQSSNMSGIVGERESHEQNSNCPEVNIQDNIISEDRNNGDERTSTETNNPQKHGQNQGRKRRHCRKCGKDYSTRRELKAHRCLRKLKSFPCKECEKVFARPSDLHEHMIVHIGRKSYFTSCRVCGKKFNHFFAKMEHMRIHRTYLCGECGETFELSASLKMHMKEHIEINTREKHCLCRECGETFALSASLKMHMRIHEVISGPCTECGRTFATLTGLKTHMRLHVAMHNEIKPFPCFLCEKEFTQRVHRKRHLLTHDVDWPF